LPVGATKAAADAVVFASTNTFPTGVSLGLDSGGPLV
jgi:hypothetical protein